MGATTLTGRSFTFGDKAAAVHANGYAVVPIIPFEKKPIIADWPSYRFQPGDEIKHPRCGIGILTGVEPISVLANDIDVRDPVLNAEMVALANRAGLAGKAPSRIGAKPKILYVLQGPPGPKLSTREYRLPGDDVLDKGHKVEILRTGQQFVAFGIHPEERAPYNWNGAGNPLTVPADQLLVVTEEQLREFITAADAILAAHGTRRGSLGCDENGEVHVPNENLRGDQPTVRAAVAVIPNNDCPYDYWVRMLLAIKGALGDSGLDIFLEWSAKSSKHQEAYAEKTFKSAKADRIGAGTIFFEARKHGWKRPSQPGEANTE